MSVAGHGKNESQDRESPVQETRSATQKGHPLHMTGHINRGPLLADRTYQHLACRFLQQLNDWHELADVDVPWNTSWESGRPGWQQLMVRCDEQSGLEAAVDSLASQCVHEGLLRFGLLSFPPPFGLWTSMHRVTNPSLGVSLCFLREWPWRWCVSIAVSATPVRGRRWSRLHAA